MTASGPTTNIGSPRSPLRLFVALWPSAATRARIAAAQRTLAWPDGSRLVPATDLHLTLAFIGSVAADRLAAVRQAAAVPGTGMALSLDRLQVWPKGTVVLTPSDVPAALTALQQRLAASLRAAGVTFDDGRPFVPHVTLARAAAGLRAAPLPPLAWRSQGHVLAVSADGHYRVAARFG